MIEFIFGVMYGQITKGNSGKIPYVPSVKYEELVALVNDAWKANPDSLPKE